MTQHRSDKLDALEHIKLLMDRHQLSIQDITGFLNADTDKQITNSNRISHFFAYIGGLLVFAGIGIYISMFWDEMSNPMRIIVSLGTGFMTYIMAITFLADEKLTKLSTPFFLVSTLLQPTGIFVTMDVFSTGADERYGVIFMCLVMLTQQILTLWATQRSVLVFTILFFISILCMTIFDLYDLDDEYGAALYGLFFMFFCFAIDKTRHHTVTPFWYLLASFCLYAGGFEILDNAGADILFLGLVSFGVFISTLIKSRILLFTSSVAALAYIGHFTAEHFADSVGWPISLMIMGLVFIVLSKVALVINQKYMQPQGS